MRFFFSLSPLHTCTPPLNWVNKKKSNLQHSSLAFLSKCLSTLQGAPGSLPLTGMFSQIMFVTLASLLAFFKLKQSKLTETNTRVRLNPECFLALGELGVYISQEYAVPFLWTSPTLTIPALRAPFQAPDLMTGSLSSVAFTLCESLLAGFGYH